MCPLRVDFWGLWPRQFLAGLAILLAAAVLSLVLFPAGHGSFVNTHGPATALRSRRLFLAIYLWFSAFLDLLPGRFDPARWRLQLQGPSRQPASLPTPAAYLALSVPLLC
jgi:hypothetical protein